MIYNMTTIPTISSPEYKLLHGRNSTHSTTIQWIDDAGDHCTFSIPEVGLSVEQVVFLKTMGYSNLFNNYPTVLAGNVALHKVLSELPDDNKALAYSTVVRQMNTMLLHIAKESILPRETKKQDYINLHHLYWRLSVELEKHELLEAQEIGAELADINARFEKIIHK